MFILIYCRFLSKYIIIYAYMHCVSDLKPPGEQPMVEYKKLHNKFNWKLKSAQTDEDHTICGTSFKTIEDSPRRNAAGLHASERGINTLVKGSDCPIRWICLAIECKTKVWVGTCTLHSRKDKNRWLQALFGRDRRSQQVECLRAEKNSAITQAKLQKRPHVRWIF